MPASNAAILALACVVGCTSCQTSTRTTGSDIPRFAQTCIHQVEKRHGLDGTNEATTFVGADSEGHPFVAITDPKGTINQMTGKRVRGSGTSLNTFVAHPMFGELFISKDTGQVNVFSVIRFNPMESYKVTVGADETITLDFGLLEWVIQKQAGNWRVSSVHCRFPKKVVSERELRSEVRALEKIGSGDITFPSGHCEREERYRMSLFNYVVATHAQVGSDDVYMSEETSNTLYLAHLLSDSIKAGAVVSFDD